VKPSERLVQLYKTAAADKAPPRILALIRRTVSSSHPEYKHLPNTESPHLFTMKSDTHFSVGVADMRILIRNGLMRIQVNDPGKITLYFADEHEDEERHDGPANDMKGRG
jgi:hypothetical protein